MKHKSDTRNNSLTEKEIILKFTIDVVIITNKMFYLWFD